MQIDTNLLPNRLHLKGDFSKMGVSIFTPSCYDKILKEGLQLNSSEKKLLKDDLSFHQNVQANKELFKSVSKILSYLSTKEVSKAKRKEIFMGLMALHYDKYYMGASLSDDLSLFCFNIGIDMESHLCGCFTSGAVSFIALKDFRGEPDVFQVY